MDLQLVNKINNFEYYNNNTIKYKIFTIKYENLYKDLIPYGYVEIYMYNDFIRFKGAFEDHIIFDDMVESFNIDLSNYEYTCIKSIYFNYDEHTYEITEYNNTKKFNIYTNEIISAKYYNLEFEYMYNKLIILPENLELIFPFTKVSNNIADIYINENLTVRYTVFAMSINKKMKDYHNCLNIYYSDMLKLFIYDKFNYTNTRINISTNNTLIKFYTHDLVNVLYDGFYDNVPPEIEPHLHNIDKLVSNSIYYSLIVTINNKYIIYGVVNSISLNKIIFNKAIAYNITDGSIYIGILVIYNFETVVYNNGTLIHNGCEYTGSFINNKLNGENSIIVSNNYTYNGIAINNMPY